MPEEKSPEKKNVKLPAALTDPLHIRKIQKETLLDLQDQVELATRLWVAMGCPEGSQWIERLRDLGTEQTQSNAVATEQKQIQEKVGKLLSMIKAATRKASKEETA